MLEVFMRSSPFLAISFRFIPFSILFLFLYSNLYPSQFVFLLFFAKKMGFEKNNDFLPVCVCVCAWEYDLILAFLFSLSLSLSLASPLGFFNTTDSQNVLRIRNHTHIESIHKMSRIMHFCGTTIKFLAIFHFNMPVSARSTNQTSRTVFGYPL